MQCPNLYGGDDRIQQRYVNQMVFVMAFTIPAPLDDGVNNWTYLCKSTTLCKFATETYFT